MSSNTIRFIILAAGVLIIGGVIMVTFLNDPTPGTTGGSEPSEVSAKDPVVGPPTSRDPRAIENGDTSSRSEAETVLGSEDDVDPDLGRGGFSGFVKDKNGAPIEGASVELFRGSTALIGFRGTQESTGLVMTTDDAGVYTFENVPASKDYVIVGEKEGLGRDETTIAVRRDDMVVAADLILGQHGAKIHGIANGIGDIRVVGAKVSLFDVLSFASLRDPIGERVPEMVTTTDDQGYYEFQNVGLRAVEITVDHPEWTFATKTLNSPFQPLADTELHFLMRIPVALQGVVVDQAGNVIPGAEIDAFELNSTPEVKGTPATITRSRAKSGKNGAFSLTRLRQRVQYSLTIRADGYRILTQSPVSTENTDVQGLVITLEAQGGVAGVVISPDGKTPTPYTVRVMRYTGGNVSQTDKVQTFKAANGAFLMENLDPGQYSVEATARGFAPTLSAPFLVATAQVTQNVEVVLSRGATVRGTLYDPEGNPISGAKVTIQPNRSQGQAMAGLLALLGGPSNGAKPPSTKTNSEGQFEINNLTPDTYQVEIEKVGFSPNPINDVALVADQPTDIGAITLSRGGTIFGRVVDASGGAFQAGVVTCTNQVAPGIAPETLFNREVRPDADGRFEVSNVPAGDYLLQFKPDATALATPNLFGQIAIAEKTKKTVRVANNGTVEQKIVLPPEVERRG